MGNSVSKSNISTNTSSKIIKDKDYIVMYKGKGTFISIYDEDAFIFNLLFGYKILPGLKCGFPNTALEKVLNYLETNKVSYKIMYND